MTTTAKTRWLRVGLIVLALWPLVQHVVLVRGFGATPWKLGAWGMYAAPQDNVGVTVLVTDPSTGRTRPLSKRVLPPDFWDAAAQFSRERWALGRLVRPQALGRRVLEALPPAQAITIVVSRLYVDRRTAKVELEQTPYEFRR